MMITNRKIKFKEQCDGILGKILNNIGGDDFVWHIESDGIISQSSDTGYLFEKEEYSNVEFQEKINQKDYYTTCAQIELYSNKNLKKRNGIRNLHDFIKSNCEFIVFIVKDFEIIIFSKNEELINQIDNNIKGQGYEITEENSKYFFKELSDSLN